MSRPLSMQMSEADRPSLTEDRSSEQWGHRLLSEDGSFVTRPPSAMPNMSSRRSQPSIASWLASNATPETFPMRRDNQPNYQRLTRGYYRLHQRNGQPLLSRERIHADDPSLAEFAFEHLPPPATISSLKYYICAREMIHPSRVRVYLPLSTPAGMENGVPGSPPQSPTADRPLSKLFPISMERPNDETWVYRIEVSMDQDETVEDLFRPRRTANRVGQDAEECCQSWDNSCRACPPRFRAGFQAGSRMGFMGAQTCLRSTGEGCGNLCEAMGEGCCNVCEALGVGCTCCTAWCIRHRRAIWIVSAFVAVSTGLGVGIWAAMKARGGSGGGSLAVDANSTMSSTWSTSSSTTSTTSSTTSTSSSATSTFSLQLPSFTTPGFTAQPSSLNGSGWGDNQQGGGGDYDDDEDDGGCCGCGDC